MKLISDFDGVWTNPDAEAACLHKITLEGVSKLVAVDEKLMARAMAAASDAMNLDPTRYGWTIEGQITAFSDEDPFVRNNAFAHFVELLSEDESRIADEELRAVLLSLKEKATAEHGNVTALANILFGKAAKKHREEAKPKPSDEVVAAMHTFLKDGHDVVIVSNSSTDKIADFLSRSTLPYVTGGVDAHEKGKIRVRGGAMKFVIGQDIENTIDLGGRRVRCDRASYDKILDEEQGDAIVGDVVSLDFALPWKRRRDRGLDQRFFVVVRHYTPEWSRKLCETDDFTGITGLDKLPETWLEVLDGPA
jgi:hypothetical protein